MSLAGQVTAAVIDQLGERLGKESKTPVRRTVDTESVTRFEADVEAAGKLVPIAVTVFKDAERVRIQVLNHVLDRPEAEKLEDHLADVLDLRIIDRSSAESEAKVRDAMDHDHRAPAVPAADKGKSRPFSLRRKRG
jgi:hypothetical protein